jgi:hypothetical protein
LAGDRSIDDAIDGIARRRARGCGRAARPGRRRGRDARATARF